MKRKIINILAVLAIVAGLAIGAVATWWVVWLVAFPAVYLGILALIKFNTNYIETL